MLLLHNLPDVPSVPLQGACVHQQTLAEAPQTDLQACHARRRAGIKRRRACRLSWVRPTRQRPQPNPSGKGNSKSCTPVMGWSVPVSATSRRADAHISKEQTKPTAIHGSSKVNSACCCGATHKASTCRSLRASRSCRKAAHSIDSACA